ncbi:histone acetyltransferase-1 [Thecamonas trahens ATCC 50062]|uniref:histone acetyltransferase n=1 Tax=Thecamonas trahens ATCC 50062 TaxID=461836 RepID=A0A0L0DV22_THETB|nr:histone acetyltransferase-1 [Thecamonas trahens ATCC 50062]KNC56139.1 histone acetyltransferase-1 [Thecamonas trahens ATCC 50062]|eukprot:XP_013761178.1 histone acetyltransferase-1 [Thecamonas trahens ATCC 50062]
MASETGDEPLPDNVCLAYEATTLTLVEEVTGDEEEGKASFPPEMMHQVFEDDEKIYGYTDLAIELLFNATTLDVALEVKYSAKVEAETNDGVPADDIGAAFVEWLEPSSMLADRAALLDSVAASNAPDAAAGAEVPGTEMASWSRDDGTYTVYRGTFDDEALRALHKRMRFFPIVFIDAARFIEDTDPRWDVYTLWRRASGCAAPKFVGYATCYRFAALPDSIRYRVSQFIILPPFQRAGHGLALLETIFDHARATDKIIEITVEDPAPAFVTLRDVADLKACLAAGYFKPDALGAPGAPLAKDTSDAIRAALKLTATQVARTYEAAKLAALTAGGADADALTAFRLAVKQRLFKKHLHSTHSVADMLPPDTPAFAIAAAEAKALDERKVFLAAMYNQLAAHYAIVWAKASAASGYAQPQ